MKRIKIAVVTLIAVGALAAGLGAKAMPISERQSTCTGSGGSWTSWVWFYEDDDGTLVGFSVSVCTTPMNGYDSIRAYFDEDQVDDCFHSWNGGGHNCRSPWWNGEKAPPSPTPTPTSTTTGTTSGTYSDPTVTPTPMPTTTSGTGTTSGTYSR
jgi:hypothetical protein